MDEQSPGIYSNDFDWLFLAAVYDYLQRVTLDRIRYFIYSFFLSCSLSCNNITADSKINIFPCQQRCSFLMLCLPEFTQPTLHFMLVFICAIYFVITPEFSSSSFLAQGKQLLLCPLSMNSLHLLSNIVLLDSGNFSSN